MLNSLKFLDLFLADLIRGKFIIQFLMGKIEDNLFFLDRDINQKQIKYRIDFMDYFWFHKMNLNCKSCYLIAKNLSRAISKISKFLVFNFKFLYSLKLTSNAE